MTTVIAMLRAVNVGGHQKIGMEPLRKLFESLGLHQPRTFIQSGNVVFATTEKNLVRLRSRIGDSIEQNFGFRPEIILRTAPELRDAIARNPFADRPDLDPARLLVFFLAGEPAPAARELVLQLDISPEELHFRGRELYIYYTNGMARPRVSTALIEKRLKTPGTGRNWNTVNKLLHIAASV